MSHFAFGSWMLKSVAALLMTVLVVGSHGTDAAAAHRLDDSCRDTSACGGPKAVQFVRRTSVVRHAHSGPWLAQAISEVRDASHPSYSDASGHERR